MRWGSRWSPSEGGPLTHEAGAPLVPNEAGPLAHAARASVVPKRRRPARPCGGGLGGP